MDEYKNDNRRSVLLEGMYNGMAGKIEEMQRSVKKELQYSSAQQVDAYEALTEEYRKGVEALLAELRYLSQQNSAIYDYGQREQQKMRDALVQAMQQKLDEAVGQLTQYVNGALEGLAEPALDYDALAQKVAEKLRTPVQTEKAEGETAQGAPFDETFDYDLLAEKIATALPETDYDLIADRVAAVLPAVDENALSERIVAAIPAVDENAIAEHVAENMTPVDHDLIAERVVSALGEAPLKLSDESIEKIAVRVAELLRADETDLDRVARDALAEETEIAAAAPVVVPVAVPAAETPAVVIPEPPEGMMTRYKRSFIAKIIGSDEEVKGYYSDLKNALLRYRKASSQVSWTNDRFTLRGETVAKIGIRGRTLCLYVALDPNEFPETTYHQKYAGDTKMYEKTPMMVKIKSKVALKRAIRLVELLMEKNGAVAEETEPVDYVAEYAYRSEEELLAEGLIKTAIVERSDLDF